MNKRTFLFLGLLAFVYASFVSLSPNASAIGRTPEPVDTAFMSVTDARSLFGSDMIGPDAYAAFGVELDSASILPLRFTRAQCVKAESYGMMLVYFTDSVCVRDTSNSNSSIVKVPLTVQLMYQLLGGFSTDALPLFFTDMTRAVNQLFYTTETSHKGWRFVSKTIIDGSSNQNYLEQTQALMAYVGASDILFSGNTDAYQRFKVAADTFNNLEKPKIASLLQTKKKETPDTMNLQRAGMRLAALPINASCRETAVELVCRMILYLKQNKVRLFSDTYVLTGSRTSDGTFVRIGPFMLDGINVDVSYPDERRIGWGTTASIGEQF